MKPPDCFKHPEAERQGTHESVEQLFRRQSAQLVSTLARIFGLDHLDAVEDAVQEAMMSALRTWPEQGVPDNPVGMVIPGRAESVTRSPAPTETLG